MRVALYFGNQNIKLNERNSVRQILPLKQGNEGELQTEELLMMEARSLNLLRERLQRERRELVQAAEANDGELNFISAAPREELEEQAQRERDALASARLGEAEQARVEDIDNALARMDAGTYEKCENCGKTILEKRLRAEPATRWCAECAHEIEVDRSKSAPESDTPPKSGRLPADLDGLDDSDLAQYLAEPCS